MLGLHLLNLLVGLCNSLISSLLELFSLLWIKTSNVIVLFNIVVRIVRRVEDSIGQTSKFSTYTKSKISRNDLMDAIRRRQDLFHPLVILLVSVCANFARRGVIKEISP